MHQRGRTMRAVFVGAVLLSGAGNVAVWSQSAEIQGFRRDVHACHAMTDTAERLRCYDGLSAKLDPPFFQGTLADETAPFTIDRPMVLRYQSDGPVFVMYLKDAKGDIVQNLHIGGGGEARYTISKPGTYSLQVSGTDTWRVWMEPEAPAPGSHG